MLSATEGLQQMDINSSENKYRVLYNYNEPEDGFSIYISPGELGESET